MTQKQYDDMRTIMQCGRIFADAMRRAMKNAGLLDIGYELHVDIENTDVKQPALGNVICSVELQKDVTEHDDWMDTRMTDFKFGKVGWLTNADPVVKPGNVPPVVCTRDAANRVYPGREKAQKPVAPDGLWISRFDDPCPVDGGV